MISLVGYTVLALTALAMGADAIENEAPKNASAEGVAWEIAWSVAMYDHRESAAKWEKLSPYERGRQMYRDALSKRRDRSDAREIYGDAWAIFKRARAIYEADRDGRVATSGENLQFAMQIYEDARMKCSAAYKAEWAAKSTAASAARAMYETGRERNIAAWENYQTALQMYEVARMKREAAYKAERAALRAIRDAVSEARNAASSAVQKAGRSTRRR